MATDVPIDLKPDEQRLQKPNNAWQRLTASLAGLKPASAFQIIFVLAIFQGLISFVVTPPWWHYDEPGHFEYVWLAAHSPTWPIPGQYDASMRKELGASLLKYGWYEVRNLAPDLTGKQRIPIGIEQVGDRPGYYLLASLPLRLIPHADILVQYYAARFVSLLLYLLIVIISWYALGEILRGDHPLRWMTTIFVALLPAFADSMASVNNDVSAVLASTLFLWSSLRLIQRGFSIGRLLFLASSLVVCYLSKNTAYFAFALAPIVLLLTLLRGRFAVLLWCAVAVAALLLGAYFLQWGGPRAWYQGPTSLYPARVHTKAAPVGDYAFQIGDAGSGKTSRLLQFLLPNQVKSLRKKTVTLGFWVWGDQATLASPVFVQFLTNSGQDIVSPREPTQITTNPVFHAVSFNVPEDAIGARVYMQVTGDGLYHNSISLDGLVLAEGEFKGAPPKFSDAGGALGSWGTREFNNLLRNGSGEQASLQIRRSRASSKLSAVLDKSNIDSYLVLAAVQDWKGMSWYYRDVASNLLRTFWASLAGDKASLRSTSVNSFLQWLTLAGVLGALVHLWRRRRTVRWDLVGLLGIALFVPWSLALIRGTSSFLPTFLHSSLLYPWARYAYPAILPTALLLCAGWLEWLNLLSIPLKFNEKTTKAIFLGLMLGISIFAFMNAIQVLHPQWWSGWGSLLLLLLFQSAAFYLIIKWQKRSSVQEPPVDNESAT
jgi:hypothetical protein